MKLLLIDNGCNWATWPQKKAELKKWFAPLFDLQITEIKTNFTDIPFTNYSSSDDQQNAFRLKGIDPIYYDQHFSPLAKGYDIVLVVLPRSLWPWDADARGWRADKTYGAIELQVACDEYERLTWFGKDDGDMFHNLARHEILHALFMHWGIKDTVHYWWNQDPQLLTECLKELKTNLSKISLLERLIDLYKRLIILMSNKTPSQELVELSLRYNGQDFTDDQKVADDVSCVFALTTLLHMQDSRVPIMYNTKLFDDYLKDSPLFRKINDPITQMEGGYICVSPTGSGGRPDLVPLGHTGLYLDSENIMSNDSITGLWSKNYTRATWRKRYGERGQYPIRIYQKVV